MFTFSDLKDEVKRRSTRDQAGTQFDTAVANAINFSLFRIANEAPWTALRRKATIETLGTYSTGTASVSVGSRSVTFSGANLITAGIQVGQRIKFTGSNGSSTLFSIDAITGENAVTINLDYDGTGSPSGETYTILGLGIYNLPPQCARVGLIWHEAFGSPMPLQYVTDRSFYDQGIDLDRDEEPLMYMMWGEDMTLAQPRSASVVTVVSSSASDTTQQITVFGDVSGYPDYEVITLNGTTNAVGSKSFTTIERISKDGNTVGRVTATTDSGSTTIAVLPVGDTTAGIKYKKIHVFPFPDDVYELKVQYYKEPFRLVNDDDIHELGSDFDELIILLSTAKLNAEQSKQKDIEAFFTMFKDELAVLRRKNADKLDWLPRLQRPRDSGFGNPRLTKSVSYSQFGSAYGPRSYW